MLKGTKVQATYEDLMRLARDLGDAEGQQAAARDEEQEKPLLSARERQAQTIDFAMEAYRKHQKEHNECWQIPEQMLHLWLMTYALAYFAGYQNYRDRLARYRAGHNQRVARAVVAYLVRVKEREQAEKLLLTWSRRNLTLCLQGGGVPDESFDTLPERQLVHLFVDRLFPIEPLLEAVQDLGIDHATKLHDTLPSFPKHSEGWSIIS